MGGVVRAVKPPHHTNGSGNGAGVGRSSTLGAEDRVRPVEHVDMALEAAVLGALIVDSASAAASGVRPSDFYSGANGVLCGVLLALAATRGGRPVGAEALRSALLDAGKLEQVGGEGYLSQIDVAAFPLAAADYRRLRLLARRRVVAATARRVARAAGDELAAAMLAYDEARRELDLLERPAEAACLSIAEHALSMRPLGARYRTGFVGMDEAFRGGVPLGSLLMLNGAPAAGKTAFAAVLGDRWERAGCAVLYVAADQHVDGIVVRWAQLAGHSREAFEAEGIVGENVRAEFARANQGRALYPFDPYRDVRPRPLEQAITALEQVAGDRPRVLIVDSLQTVPCAAAEGAEGPRAAVDAVIGVLKNAARRGTTVIVLSEAHRGTYGAKSKVHQGKGIASGKESSAIEFQADALLYFAAVDGEPDLIDVEIAKNSRFGNGPCDVRLSLDRQRHTLTEIALESNEGAERAAERERARGKVHRDALELIKLLAKHPEGLGTRRLRDLARADGLKRSNGELDAALALLGGAAGVEGVRAVNRGTANACRWVAEPVPGGAL